MSLYLSDIRNDGDTPRLHVAKHRGFCHNLRKYLREYNEATGIHGLRYLTEKRSRVEKVVWMFLLLTSLGGCIYMIYEVLYKYHNTPVVVSFATEDTPIYEIPFPAVTICPESKYSREKFDYSKVFSKLTNKEIVEANELTKFDYLEILCDVQGDLIGKNCTQKTVNETFFEVIDELKPDAASMLIFCDFMDNDVKPCDEFLTPILTDQGICYSFNVVGRNELFREHVAHYENYHNVQNSSKQHFDNEFGYLKNASLNTYPRRALASGADRSFDIFLKQSLNNTDYICNGFFQGFRVLIHSPWEIPRLSKHSFHIPLDKVIVAALNPELITTSPAVAKFEPNKRQCYMKNERFLMHFEDYSQSNCLLECITNYTLHKCECVSFFMPRDNVTAICGCGSSNCTQEAEDELKVKELEAKLHGKSYCDCKPSCANLKFNVETSHSDFYFKQYFEAHPFFDVEDDGSHWSVLQIYFKSEQFMTMERNELYGISDLISNLGGLLGLFTGFSLISLVEIIYFCSLRIFYNEKLYGIWSGAQS